MAIMTTPLLAYLRSTLSSLTPTDRRIAECVLADPEKIDVSPIAHLSAQSHASVGSIVAFCRHVGLKGFADFKLALARDLAHSERIGVLGSPKHVDSPAFEKLFALYSRSLTDTLQLNTQQASPSSRA
jgi:DNA-binding MurR/RpiR family transcriptional regulator